MKYGLYEMMQYDEDNTSKENLADTVSYSPQLLTDFVNARAVGMRNSNFTPA